MAVLILRLVILQDLIEDRVVAVQVENEESISMVSGGTQVVVWATL